MESNNAYENEGGYISEDGNWKIYRLGDFYKKRVLSAEEQELKALKKELRDVKEERDILKKAVSIFSKSDD